MGVDMAWPARPARERARAVRTSDELALRVKKSAFCSSVHTRVKGPRHALSSSYENVLRARARARPVRVRLSKSHVVEVSRLSTSVISGSQTTIGARYMDPRGTGSHTVVSTYRAAGLSCAVSEPSRAALQVVMNEAGLRHRCDERPQQPCLPGGEAWGRPPSPCPEHSRVPCG